MSPSRPVPANPTRRLLPAAVLTVLALLAALPLAAQTIDWTARYAHEARTAARPGGGDPILGKRALATDAAGNTYVAGQVDAGTGSGSDFLTLKLDAGGALVWARTFAGTAGGHDSASALAVDGIGNVYVTGRSQGSTGGYNYATVKYDLAGALQWVQEFNGSGNSTDYAHAVAVDASGNVYVAGQVSGATGGWNYATVKYDNTGALQWAREYNGSGNGHDFAHAVAVDGSGNVHVTGYAMGASGGNNYATLRYDSAGSLLWVREYQGFSFSDDMAYALALDGSGHVYVTGSAGAVSGGFNFATLKYDAAGALLWARQYNGSGNSTDRAYALALDAGGNVYVAGSAYGASGGYNCATVKYDGAGTLLWAEEYDGPGGNVDSAYALEVDAAGNAYVAGSSYGTTGSQDHVTLKYGSLGTLEWARELDGMGAGADVSYGVAIGASGSVVVSGYSRNASGFDEIRVASYDPAGLEQWASTHPATPVSDWLASNPTSARATAVGSDGAVYLTGSTRAGNSDDYLTVKLDPTGAVVWARTHNGSGNGFDSANALAIDGAGSVYVTGRSAGATGGDNYATLKYDAAGSLEWVREYDGTAAGADYAHALVVDGSGGVYVTGSSSGATGGANCVTVKYDSAGTLLWTREYNGTGGASDSAYAAAVDGDGSLVLAGSTFGATGMMNFLTLRYDSGGTLQWAREHDGTAGGDDFGSAIAVDGAGNVLVTGRSAGATGGHNFATVKYDSAGNLLWAREHDGTGGVNDIPHALAVDTAGNVFVTGYSDGASGGVNYATVKYDGAGNLEWAREYDGTASGADYPYALAVNASGDLYVAGLSWGVTGGVNFATVKYDSAGVEQWVALYDGPPGGTDQAWDLVLDSSSRVIVAGTSRGPDGTYDYLAIRYSEVPADTTPPADPTLGATAPLANVWSNDVTVDVTWSGAADEPGGSGLAGYSVLFDGNPATQPDTTVDVPHTTDPHATTSAALVDGTWYFHLSTCDVAGNCTATAHAGPFLIDTTSPPAPTGLTSSSHAPGVPSETEVIAVSWSEPGDAGSGLDGYSWAFENSPTWACEPTKEAEEGTVSTSSGALGAGSWYFHLCARDNAGNWSQVTSAGPYLITESSLPADCVLPFESKWGSLGSGAGQFMRPFGVAAIAAGEVVTADYDSSRLQVFTPQGVFLRQWMANGPVSVASNSVGEIVSTNLLSGGSVQIFTAAGVPARQWPVGNPYGLAVAADDSIWVVRDTAELVVHYASDGTFLGQFGGSGTGPGQFGRPWGVAIAAGGDLFVTDISLHRVQRFTAGGVFVTQFGSPGAGPGQLVAPTGIAVSPDGIVYVAETGNNRIQAFTLEGFALCSWGGAGSGDGQFSDPLNLSFASGHLYVADQFNRRIQKFGLDDIAPSDPTPVGSTSHDTGVWTSSPVVAMVWSGASDDPHGSGLSGYSVLFDGNPTTQPDATVDVAHTADPHATTSAPLADGTWYFHLSTCDVAGNCTATVHAGPFLIDATAPSAPGAVTSASHGDGLPKSDPTIDIAWAAASDALSGVALYRYAWTSSATQPSCSSLADTTAGTTATSAPLASGTWYAHVCAVDGAGNEGAVATGGPYVVDTAGPTGLVVTGTSHTVSTWSNDSTVDFNFSGAVDPSGVAGYSVAFDQWPGTVPDTTVDQAGTSYVGMASPDGSDWYVHVRGCDTAGNCGATVHSGPYWIDTAPPSAPGEVTSASHGDGAPKLDPTIDIVWDAATDALSGVALYRYGFTGSATQPSCSSLLDTTSATSAASEPLADGTWYAHLCATDSAGNEGAVVTGGPYRIGLEPPAQRAVLRVDYADWIEAPPVAGLDLPSELTIELWVYLEEAALPNEPLLWAELPGGQLGFGLFWDGSGRRVWFAETERLSGEVAGCCQSPQLELGQWAHVAFTLAPDLTPRIYVDGVEGLGGGLSGFPVDTSSAVVRLASFRGAARLVRIWSRALDLAELRVRATSPVAGGEPGLVVAWPLDDGVGAEARSVVAPASPFRFPRDYFRGQPAWARTAVIDQPYFRSHSSPAPVAYHTGAVLDLDLDGDRDLVAHMPDPSIWATHPPVAYRNVGGVGFTEDTAALLGGPLPGLFGLSRPWTVIDLTGDGLEDVLVPDYGPDDYPFPGEQARLFVRQVDGRLLDETATRLPALTVLQHGWAVGDVNGDGAPDVVLVAFGDGGDPRLTSRLLLNDGSGHFSERTDWFPGPWPGVYLGGELLDADGDGDLDLFLASTGGNAATREHDTLLLNDGTGQFSAAPAGALPPRYLGVGWVTYDAKAADLDGDGHSDLVAVLNETPPEGGTIGQHLQLLLANGDGTFRDGSDGLPQDALAPMNGDLWVRDVNGDGLPDIVTYWASPYRRLLYLNVGGARFVDASEALPAVHAGLMPADLDGDGSVDFAGFGFHRAEIVAQEALRPFDLSTWGDFSLGVEPSHLEIETGSSATTRTVTVRAAFPGSLALESESPDPRLEVSFGAAGISAEEAVEVTVEAAPDLPAGRYAVVVRARSGEAVRQAVLNVRVTHDAPPANPNAVSSSPPPSTWWNGGTVDVSWSGAADDPGGSGLAGYSVVWDLEQDTVPDPSIELPHTADPHGLTSPPLAPDGDDWHFHLRTCDLGGNCSEPLHVGPFWIDTMPPSGSGAVTSASHGDGLPKSDPTIEIAWGAATDNLSGVALYRYGFTGSSTQPSCSALSHTTTSLSTVSDPQPDGTWYAHVCAEDEAGNEGAVTTGGPYAIDTVPPRVASVSTVRDTGDGTLGQGEVTGASITQVYLTFDGAMAGPLTDPASYRVTSAGPDLVLDTAGCGPLLGDDVAVGIASAAWDATGQRSVLRLATATSLPLGLYGAAACAVLTDVPGNALDGDGDGTGGDDFARLFGVEVTNFLANPNFDVDLAGWTGDATWGSTDADGKPTSGSARIETAAGTGATLEIVQCVPVVPDASYRTGGTARVESAVAGAPAVSLRLDFHAAPACGGAPSTAVPRLLAAGPTSGAWAPGELRGVPAPAGSASVGLRFVVEEGAAAAYAVDLDQPLLAEDFDLLDDGFESGALDAWGGAAP